MKLDIKGIELALGIQPDGPTQKFIVDAAANRMDKYVPFRTGALSGNITKTTHSIIYDVYYAEYPYHGVSKYGKPFNFNKEFHAYAGPYWDVKMMTAEGRILEQEVQNFVDKRGNYEC